ncbi:MAG: helix-turn-helix transcriptional regulator [Chloroflexota bacterium]|nr:helix-turn-helix transcriptional regulator [Chloroflexota bacterium]
MAGNRLTDDEPCFVISVAAKMVDLHPQTLRYYEKVGLIEPYRTSGRVRLYSRRDIRKLRKVARLTDDLGVNLAGVEVILNMSKRIRELQNELAQARRSEDEKLRTLRQRIKALQRQLDEQAEKKRIVIETSAREIPEQPEDSES